MRLYLVMVVEAKCTKDDVLFYIATHRSAAGNPSEIQLNQNNVSQFRGGPDLIRTQATMALTKS